MSSVATTTLYLVLALGLLEGTEADLESWINKEGGEGRRGIGDKNEGVGIYLNAFAIKLREDDGIDVAQRIASDHGFRLKFEVKDSRSG